MKSLAGAVLGAALGIGLLVLMGMYLHVQSLWPVLLVGAVCGLAMMLVAKGPGGAYLKGGLAAVAVMVAVIGGNLTLAAVLQKAGQKTDNARAAAAKEDTGGVDDGDIAAVEQVVEEEVVPLKNDIINEVSISAQKKDFSLLDAVWLSVGALIAYELGKQAAKHPVGVVMEESNKEDDDQPNQPGDV